MAEIEIQGILCKYREKEYGEEILYENLPQEEQYFRRVDIPFTDDELIAIANHEHQYTPLQKSWVDKQNNLFEKGVYAYINGKLVFIPGAYWCYVNFWTLENGERVEYREDDRIFFLLHEYLRLQTDVLGVTRLKGRRQGATSIGMFFMWFVAGRNEFKNCGTTSFTDTAAADNFQRMFMYGFKAMLPCFQSDFDSDSENFIRFVKPVEKKKKGVLAVKREGLNSYVDFKPNAINAYDSGRQSYNVPDEGGKRNKLNINSYWSRLSKTLVIGNEKVGFAYMPTTVGGKKEGGENYKKLYNDSDQTKIDPKTGFLVGVKTPTRIVTFFMPASRCFKGCIDKFGNSVEDDPELPVMGNDGRWILRGAKSLILEERSRLEGEQLMEHRRDYPLDIFDAFAFEAGTCEFNEPNIRTQLETIEANPGEWFLRRIRLYWEPRIEIDPYSKRDYIRDIIKWTDDPKGDWLLYRKPIRENDFRVIGGHFEPLNQMVYGCGVDTYKGGFSEGGSKGAICVGMKSVLEGGQEVGMYPALFYIGKPRLVQHFYEEVRKACFWYGCKVNFEIDAGDAYYGYFAEKNSVRFLEWTPALNPHKRNQTIKPGTESADPFQLAAQLECAKAFVDGTGIDYYNGHVHKIAFPHLLKQLIEYSHDERTPYDAVISMMMWLLPILKQTRAPIPIKFTKPLVQIRELKIPAN